MCRHVIICDILGVCTLYKSPSSSPDINKNIYYYSKILPYYKVSHATKKETAL